MDSATANGDEFDIYLDVNVSVVVNVATEDDAVVRVGQGPMRSGILVGVVAGVFDLCLNRTG
jgi:hypothetical protein